MLIDGTKKVVLNILFVNQRDVIGRILSLFGVCVLSSRVFFSFLQGLKHPLYNFHYTQLAIYEKDLLVRSEDDAGVPASPGWRRYVRSAVASAPGRPVPAGPAPPR